MPEKIDIHAVISRLDRLIGDGPPRCHFNNPASSEDIAAFEKRHGIRLPESYKTFLEFTNGGMIVSEELHMIIKQDKDLETAKWNANYLYGLDEMEKEYEDMESWNFGIPAQNIATYPFIPFCHTATGERLVFITLSKDEKESQILDAYHEETPETWGVVADDFVEFLDDYTKTYGNPNVLGDLERGSALEIIDPMMHEEEKKETPEEVIASTTAVLKEIPYDHWKMVLRGLAYKELGKQEEALADFNRALELKHDSAFYYFSRGDLYLSVKKNRAALIDFDIAVKLEPDDTLYLGSRAAVLLTMGKLSAALDDVNKAINIDEKDILAYMVRENIYITQGETDKAEADARKIEELQQEED
ncbi:MAG: SMI1/KNR4 family protein [Bacteroidetes bacterium]|nr:SMI1/KNR4 family protein [Bacteroidota bacterium]